MIMMTFKPQQFKHHPGDLGKSNGATHSAGLFDKVLMHFHPDLLMEWKHGQYKVQLCACVDNSKDHA